MKLIYFIMILLASLGALAKPFQFELKENVERYKSNNFRWNVVNLNTNTFISLRDVEERKDQEFSEYLLQKKINKLRSIKDRDKPSNSPGRSLADEQGEMDEPKIIMQDDLNVPPPKAPRSMLYGRKTTYSPGRSLADEQGEMDEPQTMMQDGLNVPPPKAPRSMLYGGKTTYKPGRSLADEQGEMDEPQTLMQDGLYVPPPKAPRSMLYGRKTTYSPGRSLVDEQGEMDDYNTSPLLNMQFFSAERNASVKTLSNDIIVDKTIDWFIFAQSLVKPVPKTADNFFRRWKHTISVFNERELSQQLFKSKFPVLGIKTLIQKIATSNVFEKLFWPFVFKNAFMNQKLGLLGLSGQSVSPKEQKTTFYEVLEKYQTVRIPFASDRIVLSFNDSDLIDGLHRSGLMETSKQYVNAGLHLYTQDEQTVIRHKVDAAMTMINKSMPELYKTIHQVIGCIAFYKAQRAGFAGGTVSSALGVIWQDPRAYKEQSVAHYAEQIVHEYIHSSLFLADLVHGTFADYNLLSRAKAYSPIKHELRDFDKVFHASYVSTGVAVFHARAGNWDKAQKLLEPLGVSVNDLDAINTEFGLLNDSGNAMLQAMKDFLSLIRLI